MQYPVHPAGPLRERGAEQHRLPLQGGATAYTRPGSPAHKPVLLVVDGDGHALGEIERQLRSRHGDYYRIVCEGSAEEGIERLHELKKIGEEVALVLADQWMSGMSGTEFLVHARKFYPSAKRVLLVAWGDRTVQGPLLRAMSLGRIDYYVNKPWGRPDERFNRIIAEFLFEWAKDRLPKFEEIRVVGEQWSARSHELRDVLNRNGVLYTFHPADSKEGQELLRQVGHGSSRLPVVVLFDGQVLVDPSNAEIADACGVTPSLERSDFDLVVIGAGPAGLAAAVYGASEGLSTLILEGEAVGGQAGTSSLIRNYLGFPWGIGGAELASRAAEQAWLFGGTFVYMRHATDLRRAGEELVVTMSCGTEVTARAVIVATGASYRRLGVPNLENLIGAGVFYGTAVSEARATEGQEVYVVGGANSAGQAAVHLSKYASRVTLLVRGRSLSASMSEYLIKEIEATENVEVRFNTRVVDGGGEGRLEYLVLEDRASGLTETVPATAMFVLIGAEPRTDWLPEEIERDKRGFIITGQDLGRSPQNWSLERDPLLLETSMPGVFAAGDVRHRSVKRVASAVGEGAIAIQLVHEYFVKGKLSLDDLGSIPRESSANRQDAAILSGT